MVLIYVLMSFFPALKHEVVFVDPQTRPSLSLLKVFLCPFHPCEHYICLYIICVSYDYYYFINLWIQIYWLQCNYIINTCFFKYVISKCQILELHGPTCKKPGSSTNSFGTTPLSVPRATWSCSQNFQAFFNSAWNKHKSQQNST